MIRLSDGLEILPFDPLTATADEWARTHEYRRARQAELRPDDPLYPDDHAEKEAKAAQENPDRKRVSYHVVRGDRYVAAGGASWQQPSSASYESGKHIVGVGAHVLEPERRRGVATALLHRLLNDLDPEVHTVLQAHAEHDEGRAFLQWLCFDERMKGAENRLDLSEVDWEMLERWVSQGESRSPDSKLEFVKNRVPEDKMESWCDIRTVLFNLMPFEDLDHGEITVTPENTARELYRWLDESGTTWHCLLVVAPDGSIEGMTDVVYIPFEPDRIHQFLTGVREISQGRGMGKWLKGAMLLFLREQYPDVEFVVTENATSNAPMMAINEQLGFKEHRTGSSYQADVAKVVAFLESV